MKPMARVLIGIVASLGAAVILGWLSGCLSLWLDTTFNHRAIADSGMGYGFILFMYPAIMGAIAGFITGSLFVVANRRRRARLSYLGGTVALLGAGLGFPLFLQSEVRISEFLILCGPSMLWMIGLILYGFRQEKMMTSSRRSAHG